MCIEGSYTLSQYLDVFLYKTPKSQFSWLRWVDWIKIFFINSGFKPLSFKYFTCKCTYSFNFNERFSRLFYQLFITFCVVFENYSQRSVLDFLNFCQTFLGRKMPCTWAIIEILSNKSVHRAFFFLFTKVFLNPTNSIYFSSSFSTNLRYAYDFLCLSEFNFLSISTSNNI